MGLTVFPLFHYMFVVYNTWFNITFAQEVDIMG